MRENIEEIPIEPGKLFYHNPGIPRKALVVAARRYHQRVAFEMVRDALRAVGADLRPSRELNWRQRLKTAGSLMIGRQAFHIIPPAGSQEGRERAG